MKYLKLVYLLPAIVSALILTLFLLSLTLSFLTDGNIGAYFLLDLLIASSSLVPVLYILSLLNIFFGVAMFFTYRGKNDMKKNIGKNFVLYGITSIIALLLLWLLINLLVSGIDESVQQGISDLLTFPGDINPSQTKE